MCRYLALVCLLNSEGQPDKHGLIDYNFSCFREAIQEVGLTCLFILIIASLLHRCLKFAAKSVRRARSGRDSIALFGRWMKRCIGNQISR